MKRPPFLFFLLLMTSLFGRAQTIPPAPEDKAVVYFARPSGLGFAINFTYFDSATLVGRFNGGKYIRYECAPGHHIFWARSENKDFVDADVDAGKIYFIEAVPRMGALKAAVSLDPVDPKDPKQMKNILKMMSKKPPESPTQEDLAEDQRHSVDLVIKGMEKYKENKTKGKVGQLLSSMYYQP